MRAAIANLCCALVLVSGSRAEPLPIQLAGELASLDVPASAVSLYAKPLESNQVTLTINPNVPRNPASVMKLVTTLAALERLGPAYTWPTEAYLVGGLKDGVLRGDLIIKGHGDPFFTPEAFWQFLRGLRMRGLQTIVGNLLIDASHFAIDDRRRDRFDGKGNRVYNAKPYALSLNFQATQITLVPDPEQGQIHTSTYPPAANLRLHNRATLVDQPCRRAYRRPTIEVGRDNLGPIVDIGGELSRRCGESVASLLTMTPLEQLAGAFEVIWRELGGDLKGSVKAGLVPPSARLLHRQRSRPLAELIRGMNKYSNNLMSRHVFLTLGAERYGAPGTVAKARRMVGEWLAERLGQDAGVFVDNGAGLSRRIRVTAAAVAQLLEAAHKSLLMPEFMSSLSIIGVDGTMRQRLRDTPLAGRGHIKTGSIDNVSSLAGYVVDRTGRRWLVVLMVNHPGIHWRGGPVQDAVLQWIYAAGEA